MDLEDRIARGEEGTADERERRDPKEVRRERGRERRGRVLPAVIAGVVALAVGFLAGGTSASSQGGSGSDMQVESVDTHVEAWNTLDSMRENEVQSLTKELAQASKAAASGSGASANAALAGIAGVAAQGAAAVTDTLDRFLGTLADSNVECAAIQTYIGNPKAIENESDRAAVKATISELSPWTVSDGERVTTRFAGTSPAKDAGQKVGKVGTPQVSLAAASAGEGGAAGGAAWVAAVPVCTEGGKVYNALYVVGMTASRSVASVDYCGIVQTSDAAALSQGVADAVGAAVAAG